MQKRQHIPSSTRPSFDDDVMCYLSQDFTRVSISALSKRTILATSPPCMQAKCRPADDFILRRAEISAHGKYRAITLASLADYRTRQVSRCRKCYPAKPVRPTALSSGGYTFLNVSVLMSKFLDESLRFYLTDASFENS